MPSEQNGFPGATAPQFVYFVGPQVRFAHPVELVCVWGWGVTCVPPPFCRCRGELESQHFPTEIVKLLRSAQEGNSDDL